MKECLDWSVDVGGLRLHAASFPEASGELCFELEPGEDVEEAFYRAVNGLVAELRSISYQEIDLFAGS